MDLLTPNTNLDYHTVVLDAAHDLAAACATRTYECPECQQQRDADDAYEAACSECGACGECQPSDGTSNRCNECETQTQEG